MNRPDPYGGSGLARLAAFGLLGLLSGAAIGFHLGHRAEPLARIERVECQEPSASTQGEGRSLSVSDAQWEQLLGTADGWTLETALRIDTLERLLGELRQHDVPPSELAAALIEHLDEEDIESAMSRLVSVDPVHLQGIQDRRAFALRMARAALAGTFEPLDDAAFEGTGEVLFSNQRERDDPAAVAASTFASGEPVIHAIVPIGEHAGQQTVLKWLRVDPPGLVAFRRLKLIGDHDFYSYGLRTSSALEPGRYVVEVYLLDDMLTPIAQGRYEIE